MILNFVNLSKMPLTVSVIMIIAKDIEIKSIPQQLTKFHEIFL